MKKLFSVLMLTMGLMTAYATNVTYTADNTTIFPNPERGFTEELGGETMLSNSSNHVIQPEASWYFTSSDRANQTLVVAIYYLGNYRSQDLSSQILQGFNEDMQILRNKGFKCVLRFAYDWNSNNDATVAWTKRHIEQLKPYLAANADVIYVLQTGFVGQWGEWYYSSHHGNETQNLTANRRQILEAMIDACPSDRFLLVRYPMIKTEYLGDETALTSSQAYTTATRARIGHHNDAFLNSYGNDGTYASTNKSDDPAVRQYIADETLYVPNGGETNVESNSKANSVYTQAESEMSTYHWSFCGSTYAEAVTDKWRSSGIYDNLDRKMGYRYQLVSGTYSDQVAPGGKLSVNMQIRNTGYAPLYNERHAYIVLKNGNNVYSLQLNSDPRRWLPNDAVTTINEQLTVPTNIPAGTYQLYLHMPDKYASLASNPKYAIRFANQGNLWDSSTGMNKLNASVVVSGNAVTPDPDLDPDPDPDPQPQEGAVQLPATLNKANVTAYSSDMTWYNTDYFDFGPIDAANTDRWAEWTVYLKYPKAYDVSEVSYCTNGHTFSLKLMNGTTEVASYTTTDDHWGAGDQSYTQSTKWDLSAVPAGTYTLRIQNATAWGQPKMKSITLFAEVPADPDPDLDPDPDPDPQPTTGSSVIFHWQNNTTTVPTEGTVLTTYAGTLTCHKTDATKNFTVESAAYTSAVPDDLKATNGKGIKFGANALYYTIEPIAEAGGFKTGDTIYICAYNTFKASTADSHSGDVASSMVGGADKSNYAVTYAVIGEGVSSASLNIERAVSSGSGLTAIKVVRPGSSQGGQVDPDPQPQEGAVQLPATLNKANVTTYSSDMTWYNTDYFDFGPTDATNTDRWAEWTVYLKHPKAYDVSEVSYCTNGHTFSLKLMDGTTEVASYTTTDDHWGAGDQSYTQSTPWDLSAVPAGTYTLRIQNATAWGQPKMKSITLFADVPTGVEEVTGHGVPVTRKILRNGQLYILRDGKMYNATGAQLKWK